jgi:hypothetical protein
MNEIDFIESIDASFPYRDENKYHKIIENSVKISDNAAFMILYEICFAPKEVSKQTRLNIISIWDNKYNHPVKKDLIEVGKLLIEGRGIKIATALKLMNKISRYNKLYNALNIIYGASNEPNKKLDILYEEITNKWKSA